MSTALRHFCRNPRCRSKLPAPVENHHHGFCARGCHASFYRSRCLVCEEPMRRKRESQKLGSGHKTCATEYRKFPRAYDFPAQGAGISDESPPSADSTGLKTGLEGERPRARCLRKWRWTDELDGLEHELRDAAGTQLARIESNVGRHRLTHPRTTPILSWSDLDEAKHRAESIALNNLPLDPQTAPRVRAANAKPHEMGPPLNRPFLPYVDSPPLAPLKPFEGDPLEIPAFFRRERRRAP